MSTPVLELKDEALREADGGDRRDQPRVQAPEAGVADGFEQADRR